MAKYNRGQRGLKRRWFVNIGDPIDNIQTGANHPNPNDLPKKVK